MKLGHSERERKGVYGLGGLVENCVVYGDRGYRGCEGVIVCDSKDMRAIKAGGGGCYKSDKTFQCW